MSQVHMKGTDQQVQLEAFRRLIEEGFSGGDTAIVDEVCAADYIEHQDGIEPKDRNGLKGAIGFLHALSPNIEVKVEDAMVSGDRLWARLKGCGTHSGTILGGPTDRPFEITIMDMCRFRDGKIVEHWGVADRLSQMEQLGIMSRPGQRSGQAE
ncbi:MAG: ester cyclase [Candidatus Dormibacteraeota bacterium]|uniref:Ester cyclase n=2 Tax=Candidatus Dormiibacter inghamiae TaxID=3127013 RepID=A0A934KHZ1_9BACT|nr:ester cyclase [Candidatus Dormibacteraeota bacterium]MBJ7606257.1 ester cyclase [Candidatus Dormibacteraeota bacterium]